MKIAALNITVLSMALIFKCFGTELADSTTAADSTEAADSLLVEKAAIITFDTLTGPLPALVKAGKKPYLVISSIEVPPEKTVTIEPGAVFLFRNFTGLHVRGKLLGMGSDKLPIIFTSENDRDFNPSSARDANPFDWDGIYMTADAIGTQLSFCKISYSVYGITSDTKFIRLDPILFNENGKPSIVVDNTEHPIEEGPFSYVLDKKNAVVNGVPVELLSDPLAPKRNIIRYIGVAAFTAGLVGGVYGGWNSYQWYKKVRKLSSTDPDNLINNNSGMWKKAHLKRNEYIAATSGAFVVTVLGGLGFYWTFTF